MDMWIMGFGVQSPIPIPPSAPASGPSHRFKPGKPDAHTSSCFTRDKRPRTFLTVRATGDMKSSSGSPSFLSLEEAGLIEMSGLDMHERFLCRLTVSSLNLLRVISEQEGMPIQELNAGRICDWFQKDKVKRERDIESATLKWESKSDW